MTTTIRAQRLQLEQIAPRQYGALLRLAGAVTLDTTLKELIDVRASQINGCAFCVDMHWKDAKAHGETDARLYSLETWEEARCYDESERAALALTDAVTLISENHVPDEVWERSAEVFDADELGQVLFAIATINTW